MKKRILVTGAAGFIGSCVVRHLNDQGYTDLILIDDIESTDKWKNLLGKKFSEFLSKHECFSWLENHKPDAIIHLGACSDTLETNGDYLMENNYRYSVKLAEIALKHNIRFIYASSAATYGDGKLGFSDDHDALEELRPLNLYGFSKHLFDLWVKQQGVLDRVVGLKYFNVFGPNEYHKGRMASMVLKMAPQVLKEESIRLFQSTEPEKFPDGGQCRDFIYVKDVARMTCSFLENDIGGIFNIGRGAPTTWNELATSLFRALQKKPRLEYIPMPEDLIKQYQNYTCADMSKYFAKVEKSPFEYNIEQATCDYATNYLVKEEGRW